jgi:hypothetical protein
LNDGRNANGLFVLELKVAPVSFGVPESEHSQSKSNKSTQLKNLMSMSSALQGFRGALEDGRCIDILNALKYAIGLYENDSNKIRFI